MASLPAGGRAREGGGGHLGGAGGHHLADLRAGAWPLPAQVRAILGQGGWVVSPRVEPSLFAQSGRSGHVCVWGGSLIPRPEVWMGTGGEGGPEGKEDPGPSAARKAPQGLCAPRPQV